MPPRIAGVGSAKLALVARCARLPRPGETLTDAEFESVPGGKGANQAMAAARLGANVRFIGCVGRDEFGRDAVRLLEREGVDLTLLRKVAARTGVALILVDAGGENQIVVAPGANRLLHADDVAVDGMDAVMCQLEIPDEAVGAAAARAGGLFCLNAAPARPVAPEVLARADLVVVNRYELELLGEGAGERLVALTLGSDGAVLLERGREIARAHPPPVEAVDGTAAGDAFCAALVVGLLEGRAYESALLRACAAGALTASRQGAQPSLPTAAELDEFLAA